MLHAITVALRKVLQDVLKCVSFVLRDASESQVSEE